MSQSQSSKPDTFYTVGGNKGVSRRRFLRLSASAATVSAVGGVGIQNTTQEAEAAAPILAGAAAIGTWYLIREGQDYFTGDDFDEDAYEELEAEEVHSELYNLGLSMEGSDDTILTTVLNRLQDTEHIAWTKAKKAAVENLNLGNEEATAEEDAHTAIEDYYATIQRNLVNHWIEQMNKWEMIRTKAQDTSDLSWVVGSNPVLQYNPSRDEVSDSRIVTKTVDLVNGDSISNVAGLGFVEENSGYSNSDTSQAIIYDQHVTDVTSSSDFSLQPPSDMSADNVTILDITTGTEEDEYDGFNGYRWRFVKADKQIETQVSELKDEVSTYVTELYASDIEPGDIDLTDFLDPAEIASEYATESDGEQHYGYAGAELAALGLKTNFNVMTDIDLKDDGTIVRGQVFYDDPDKTLEKGTVYNPDNFAGSVFLAYEYENDDGEIESDLGELEQEFEIISAVDLDSGEDVDSINAKDYVQQTSDVTATEEELAKIQEMQKEIDEQQDKIIEQGTGGGGGGGFLPDFDVKGRTVAIVAAGLVGIGILSK